MSQNNTSNAFEKRNYEASDGQIDFGFIWSVIYKDKIWIVCLCLVCAVCAYSISLAIPNKYKASVILVPAQKDGGGQFGGISSQYGGLAAMAGISIGKDSDKSDQAVVLLKSWPFIEYVIGKYNLEADIFAANGFDRESKRVLYNRTLYDEGRREWVSSKFKNTGGKPSSWMLYKKFNAFIDVQNDKKSGLLTIYIAHVSPTMAKNWLEILTKELNLHFQLIDKEDAQKNIVYLEKKIAETPVAEMQNVFFGMVEAQMKVLMLTEGSENYLFKMLVRPMVPEEKSSPRRSAIAIVGFIVGFMIWCCVAVVRFYRLSRVGK